MPPMSAFDDYRDEHEQPDFDRWREVLDATQAARVETEAELAAGKAAEAVRRAAELAGERGHALEAAEAAHAEIERVAAEIIRGWEAQR